MKIWISCLAVILMSAGCSKVDGMANTTKKMGETTDEMNKSTKNMSIVTDDLYTGMREAESVGTQTEVFDHVLHAPGIMEKAHYALIYFAAFEFQSWQGSGSDNQAARERQFARAVELFFSQILDLVDDSFPIEQNNLDVFTQDNNWSVLSVMAMTMAKLHPEQEARAREQGFQPMTFYQLLEDGLRAKSRYEKGEPVKEYQLRVLENERVARYLLQLRHNYFKALVIGSMTGIEDGLFGGLFNKIGMSLPWTDTRIMMADFPLAEMAKINEWLWKAWETQEFLKEIGSPVQHNGAMGAVVSHFTYVVTVKQWNPLLKNGYDLSKLWTLEEVKAQPADLLFIPLFTKIMPQEAGKKPFQWRL